MYLANIEKLDNGFYRLRVFDNEAMNNNSLVMSTMDTMDNIKIELDYWFSKKNV